MQIMRLAAIVLAAVCGIAAAGSKQPETFDVWLRAGVQIDETGHVQDLQWEEQSKVHAVIAERLAPVVRSWEFEPATANGQPAPTRTGLLIHIIADELADGYLAMRLADARTGPSALRLAPPAYPTDAERTGPRRRPGMGRGVMVRGVDGRSPGARPSQLGVRAGHRQWPA